MDAFRYLKKRDIMCGTYNCTTCPLGEGATKYLLTCRDFEKLYPEQAIDIVERCAINDNEENSEPCGLIFRFILKLLKGTQ